MVIVVSLFSLDPSEMEFCAVTRLKEANIVGKTFEFELHFSNGQKLKNNTKVQIIKSNNCDPTQKCNEKMHSKKTHSFSQRWLRRKYVL